MASLGETTTNTTNTTIECNRGDKLTIKLTAEENKTFSVGDKLKLSIVQKKNYSNVLFQKTYTVSEEASNFYITLSEEDTRFSEVISKPITYWYEIEYNDDQTIIGYDEEGAKEFILYPEAPNKER